MKEEYFITCLLWLLFEFRAACLFFIELMHKCFDNLICSKKSAFGGLVVVKFVNLYNYSLLFLCVT